MGRVEGGGVSHEALVHELARIKFFLAGWLEVGSSATLTPSGPLITFTDSNDRIAIIRARLGGSFNLLKNCPSTTIRFSGQTAVAIASSVRPFSPSRRNLYSQFIAWQEANLTQRAVIIQAGKDLGRSPITKEDYHDLVTRVPFVAGVLSARGSYKSDRLTVGSINRALLEALAELYGGRVTPKEPPLSSKRNNWNIPVGPARALIETVMHNDLFTQMRSRDVAEWEQRINL